MYLRRAKSLQLWLMANFKRASNRENTWGDPQMEKLIVEIRFLGDNQIEVIVADAVYSVLEERAKLRGVSVESFVSSELLRVH